MSKELDAFNKFVRRFCIAFSMPHDECPNTERYVKKEFNLNIIEYALVKYEENKNLIKIKDQIEKTNEFFRISLHGYAHESSFEYQKDIDVECIFYDGETWVVYTTKREEYKISEYGKTWKLWLDTDYDYEDMEVYELTKEEYDDFFGD